MLRLSIVLLCLLTAPQAPSQDVTSEAYAVTLRHTTRVSVAGLVAGAECKRFERVSEGVVRIK